MKTEERTHKSMPRSKAFTADGRLKDILTTGQAAELCKVSIQTIIRCCDSGKLNSHKVPGSSFRRIYSDDLLRFMSESNIRIDFEVDELNRLSKKQLWGALCIFRKVKSNMPYWWFADTLKNENGNFESLDDRFERILKT
jgi:excisionase family DNA binding protein